MNPKTILSTAHFKALFSPISPESATGENLEYESVYAEIEEARREDADLPQGVWQHELKKADWSKVETICLDALQTRSKDLQIAAWLMESWIHRYEAYGVKMGFALLLGLCRRFWDTLYPQIDGEDIDFRVRPIKWIEDELVRAVSHLPITSTTSGVSDYTWADWVSARHNETLLEQNPTSNPNEASVTLAQIRASATASPRDFYVTLCRALSSALKGATRLEAFLDKKCDLDAPTLMDFRKQLQDIRSVVNELLSEHVVDAPDVGSIDDDPTDDITVEKEEAEGDEPERKGIHSRADAYRQLAEAADYLLRTEPHSPVPYLIKRAVSWGRMPLRQLLSELVKTPTELDAIHGLLGIQAKPETD